MTKQTFTLFQDMIEDASQPTDWYPQFNFEAKDQEQATSMAQSWALYHSFTVTSVKAETTPEKYQTGNLHNEYIPRYKTFK